MALKSIPLADIPKSGDYDELKALIRRRRVLRNEVRRAEKVEKNAIERARAKRVEKTKPLQKELRSLDSRLAKHVVTHRRSLLHRFGSVIRFPDAVIRLRTDAKSLDTPRDVSDIINKLLNTRGGRKYLTFTPTLNREALANAGESMLRKLKPFGVNVSKHSFITIKMTGEVEPTTLDRRRFPRLPQKRH